VTSTEQVSEAVSGAAGRGVIARGLGRSYGDAAQNAGGLVLDLTGLDRVIAVDPEAATVTVEAGISLDRLMRHLLPLGLWIPVLPGTRQVTVGGAVAADVHGKNHHAHGSFGHHVTALSLVTADGRERALTPADELFHATLGGMGLTGVITRATLRLHRVDTAYVCVDTDRADDLDQLMALLEDGDGTHPYTVGWFDSISAGRRTGRAVVTRGRPAELSDLSPRQARSPLSLDTGPRHRVPDVLPSGLVNRVSGRMFNELWFRKAPRHRVGEVQGAGTFFHPLDGVADWNRLYGRRGFCQYQFVVPFGAEDTVRAAMELIAASGHVSCLNVLKRFGPSGTGLMSFPTPGWTMAVDLAVRPGLDRLCDELDELVVAVGGRVYLAKDSRLRPDTLAAMYPGLATFRRVRRETDPSGTFMSDLARRLRL
jgi:decaprenylphospho-beta-D-ribofuranose 2-oxidase